jgi:hypothetical protein
MNLSFVVIRPLCQAGHVLLIILHDLLVLVEVLTCDPVGFQIRLILIYALRITTSQVNLHYLLSLQVVH